MDWTKTIKLKLNSDETGIPLFLLHFLDQLVRNLQSLDGVNTPTNKLGLQFESNSLLFYHTNYLILYFMWTAQSSALALTGVAY